MSRAVQALAIDVVLTQPLRARGRWLQASRMRGEPGRIHRTCRGSASAAHPGSPRSGPAYQASAAASPATITRPRARAARQVRSRARGQLERGSAVRGAAPSAAAAPPRRASSAHPSSRTANAADCRTAASSCASACANRATIGGAAAAGPSEEQVHQVHRRRGEDLEEVRRQHEQPVISGTRWPSTCRKFRQGRSPLASARVSAPAARAARTGRRARSPGPRTRRCARPTAG